MTVALMLSMFAIFLAVDYFLRKKHSETRPVAAAVRETTPSFPPVVAGFQVPENLSYHPGHAWALRESANLVRVGIDDFATKLVGKIERITLPQRGQWVRQGQKFLAVFRDGKTAEMVSPIEGTVSDVNEAAIANPEAARKDPYGEGWLLKVESPDSKTCFRNLLSGALARSWMEEAAQRLRVKMLVPAGALAQDGGTAVDDLTTHLPNQAWTEVTKEFFLV